MPVLCQITTPILPRPLPRVLALLPFVVGLIAPTSFESLTSIHADRRRTALSRPEDQT